MKWIEIRSAKSLGVIALLALAAFALVNTAFSADSGSPAPENASRWRRPATEIQLAQSQAGAVSVSPSSVNAGETSTLTLTANGTVDLSAVTAGQIGLRPDAGVANLKIVSQSAQTLTLSFDLALEAEPGTRTLFVRDSGGGEIVALDLQVIRPGPVCVPHCPQGQSCVEHACIPDKTDACQVNECTVDQKCCPDEPAVGLHVCKSKTATCRHT